MFQFNLIRTVFSATILLHMEYRIILSLQHGLFGPHFVLDLNHIDSLMFNLKPFWNNLTKNHLLIIQNYLIKERLTFPVNVQLNTELNANRL